LIIKYKKVAQLGERSELATQSRPEGFSCVAARRALGVATRRVLGSRSELAEGDSLIYYAFIKESFFYFVGDIMKYICSTCKYSGTESGNWTRHIKSSKHLKNILDDENLKKEQDAINQLSISYQPVINQLSNDDKLKFVCPCCNENFTTRQALSRHVKYRCLQNKQNKQNEQNEALIIELKKQIKELKNDKEYLKNTMSDVVDAVKYSTSAASDALQQLMQ
jgi:predicted RNA-binding Zn-ribbon protein involved in translation (DUF1610 family)